MRAIYTSFGAKPSVNSVNTFASPRAKSSQPFNPAPVRLSPPLQTIHNSGPSIHMVFTLA